MKMKTRLLFVVGLLFTLCLSVVCGLGFSKPTYKVSAESTSIEMVSGAAVRLVANDPGLRFMASISKEEYNTVKNANGTFYMFILPNSYRENAEINEANTFGENAVYCWGTAQAGKTQIVRCSANELTQTSEDGNTYYFACALTSIKTQNYELDFFARAYYEVDGVRTWAPLNENNVRSVSYVAQKALGDAEYTPTASGKTALLEYVTQFEEVNETAGQASLYVADLANVASIAVDGEAATYTNTDGKAVLSNLTKGRHTATVTHNDGSTWDVPFVYADYVIRNFADVLGLVDYYTENDTNTNAATITLSNKYITVANNVVCEATDFVYPSTITSVNLSGSTFDGYGHALKGLHIGQGCTGLLGHLTSATVKDLALVDLVLNNTSKTQGLCGNINNTSKVENVFVSGYAVTLNKDNVSLLAGEIKGTIENCVVIDNSYAYNKGTSKNVHRAVLGKMKADATDAKLTNVILKTVASNYALCTGNTTNNVDASLNDDRVENLTRVGHTATAEMRTVLIDFVAMVDEEDNKVNNFTYDAATYTLYLNGNAIYTVA